MATTSVNGIKYFYEEIGDGHPLVLIPGLGCDNSVWAGIMSHLSAKYRVLLIDNRDSGRSDYVDYTYTIDDMADDIVCLIKYLGYERANVLGHSMGGTIAQSIAYRYPQQLNKLVISNSLVKIPIRSKVALDLSGSLQMSNVDLSIIMQSIAPWIYSADFFMSNDNLCKLVNAMYSYPYKQRPDGFVRQLRALSNFDSSKHLHKVSALTLVVAGKCDLLTPKEESETMVKHIANSRLTILPGSHMPFIENPTLYIKTIIDFLK